MHQLSDKLLAILLALLLGLLPIQSAMAGFAAFPDQEESVHQMVGMQTGDDAMSVDQMAHDCEQCESDNYCKDSTCASSHCAFCVVAVPSFISLFTDHVDISYVQQADDTFLSHSVSSLYRPPRA